MWDWLIGIGAVLSGHHYLDSGGKLYDPEQQLCHGKIGLALLGIGSAGWYITRDLDDSESE